MHLYLCSYFTFSNRDPKVVGTAPRVALREELPGDDALPWGTSRSELLIHTPNHPQLGHTDRQT